MLCADGVVASMGQMYEGGNEPMSSIVPDRRVMAVWRGAGESVKTGDIATLLSVDTDAKGAPGAVARHADVSLSRERSVRDDRQLVD